MRIYSASQLKGADQETLLRQHISSEALMERAASIAFQALSIEKKKGSPEITVFCGVGNNGGDGLVIARKLVERACRVRVCIVKYSPLPSAEFSTNLIRLKAVLPQGITVLDENSSLEDLPVGELVIDAIFGTGLNRPLSGWLQKLIEKINTSKAKVIAIDMPSGLFSDRGMTTEDTAIKAQETLSFQSPKLVFFFKRSSGYVGQWKVLDIGLDREYLETLCPQAILLDQTVITPLLKDRSLYAHKGDFGHCLVVGGSYGMMGSMVLATSAALRSGAGKVTAYVPHSGYDILQICTPEAMVLPCPEDRFLAHFEPVETAYQSVCFGMGAGKAPQTAIFMKHLMQSTKVPMVIDADGINLLAVHNNLKEWIPENSILTPHPKELARLVGEWEDDFAKIEKTKAFAKEHRCVILVKGAHTFIITGSELFVNSTGNPGMATAGSGDVLAGFIGGLLAQGYAPKDAAIVGVYLHGLAGDLAVQNSSQQALIARDIIHNFGGAYKKMEERNL